MAKMRSPNYPAMGLSDALQRVRALWAKEKRTPVSPAVAAEAIGYRGLSGPSRTALASMKKYGLVDNDDRSIRVSDLALSIMHPSDAETGLAAVQQAALNPELFRQMFEKLRDASDGALKSYLITKLEFSEVGARQLIRAYRDTLAVAKLDGPASYPSQAMAELDHSEIPYNEALDFLPVVHMAHRTLDHKMGSGDKQQKTTQQTYSWPLSPGVMGEVRIIGAEATLEHLEAIREYLAIAERMMGVGKKTTVPSDPS